ncbi:hypothetical protein AQU20_21470 [Escherichia albertii]|nr:hypothetical protein AQU20_21470 [Escherichia albertii]
MKTAELIFSGDKGFKLRAPAMTKHAFMRVTAVVDPLPDQWKTGWKGKIYVLFAGKHLRACGGMNRKKRRPGCFAHAAGYHPSPSHRQHTGQGFQHFLRFPH